MNKNQVSSSANEEKGKAKGGTGKAAGAKKDEKHGGKGGAVLGDVNDDSKKATKSTRKETK